MNRADALPYIAHVLTDALGALPLDQLRPDATLIGWQCGFEPMFVAVQSYLPGVTIDADDAEGIAVDYLDEMGWFADGPTEPDHYILPNPFRKPESLTFFG